LLLAVIILCYAKVGDITEEHSTSRDKK